MTRPDVETVADHLSAAGASCERVGTPGLQDAILAAVEPPAVATPTAPLTSTLAGTHVSVDPTGAELADATTGVTTARGAVAETGSLLLGNFADATGLISVFVDRHVAVVPASGITDDIGAALSMIGTPETGTESAILATGPSATADMGALVQGAHGPAEVDVILWEE